LAYVALEWVLIIALLLINGLLAYAIAVVREPSRRGDEGATDMWRSGRGTTGVLNRSCVRTQARGQTSKH
jgi:hypothetical protein